MTTSKLFAVSLIVLALAGCATGGGYVQENWTPPSADSDWEIDSAICLEVSEAMTDDDWAKVESIKEAQKALAGPSYHSINPTTTGAGADMVTAAYAVFATVASANSATAEDKVKQEKFADCLTERGWKDADEADDEQPDTTASIN